MDQSQEHGFCPGVDFDREEKTMQNKLLVMALGLAVAVPAVAQSGEDHRAKSDVTNRAGSNGSTGATNRDPRLGADPNLPAGSSIATPATAPRANQGAVRTDRAARAKVKKVQAEQRSSNRETSPRSEAHD